MTRELGGCAAIHLMDAFIAYKARGGPQSFDEWADGKDLAAGDRALLREMYERATQAREAS
jgi:hypothetical protein